MKLKVNFGWFFIDIFGLMCSFGLALFPVLEMVSLHGWELVRSPGKFICERLNETKVIQHVKNEDILDLDIFPGPQDLSGTQDRALTRNGFHTWLEELASESNTIQAQGNISRSGRLELQTK